VRGRCAICDSELDHVPGIGRAAQDAADDVRQPGRRAARDARGAGGRGRRENARMPSLRFSRVGRNLYSLLDINFAQIFIAFIVCCFR
jgi:hypothetical protein